MCSACCPIRSGSVVRKARQPSLIQCTEHAHSTGCCPIGTQEFEQVEAFPQGRAHDGEQAREAVAPCGQVCVEPQQHVDQQGRVDLPSHRVGAVAEEVAQLECLLDLLEEDLDVPPPTVELAYRARAPFKIVGQEDHLAPLAIDFCYAPR